MSLRWSAAAAVGVLLVNADDLPQFAPREIDAFLFLGKNSRGAVREDRSSSRLILEAVWGIPVRLGRAPRRPTRDPFCSDRALPFLPHRACARAVSRDCLRGLGTTSLKTLHSIYKIDAYCPINLMRSIYCDHPKLKPIFEQWIEDYSPSLISV